MLADLKAAVGEGREGGRSASETPTFPG